MPVCPGKVLRELPDTAAASTDNAVITHQSIQNDVFCLSFWVHKERSSNATARLVQGGQRRGLHVAAGVCPGCHPYSG